jgi:hypothetical protein
LLKAMKENEKAQSDLTRLYLNGGGTAIINDTLSPTPEVRETSRQ